MPPLHGKLESDYYGASVDPKVISEWAAKLIILDKEQEQNVRTIVRVIQGRLLVRDRIKSYMFCYLLWVLSL